MTKIWNHIDVMCLLLILLVVLLVVFSTINHTGVWKIRIIESVPFVLIYICARCAFSVNCAKAQAIVISGFELAGIYEAVLGIRQLIGISMSKHVWYAMTGSFLNPGPFGGFLALVASVAFAHVWKDRMKLRFNVFTLLQERNFTLLIEIVQMQIAVVSLLLCLVMLPASFSRSGWVAFFIAIILFYRTGKPKKLFFNTRHWFMGLLILFAIVFIGGIFLFKKESAIGRFHMWHMEFLAIAKRPLTGYGVGMELGTYGNAQHDYFAEGLRNKTEIRTAGCPEYIFNEYLKFGIQGGVLCLLLAVAITLLTIYNLKKSALCFGMTALAIFACASYPLSTSEFRISTAVLLAAAHPVNRIGMKSRAAGIMAVATVACLCLWTKDSRDKKRQTESYVQNRSFAKSGLNYLGLADDLGQYYENMRNDYRYLYEYGWALYKENRYTESIGILKEGALISSDPMFHNIIGKDYQKLGYYRDAEKEYYYAHYMVPSRLYPQVLLMNLYLRTGNTAKAFVLSERIASSPVNEKNLNMIKLREQAIQCRDSLTELSNMYAPK